MRFAHISDLHLYHSADKEVTDDKKIYTKILKVANDLQKLKGVIDFIIVSGDLTEDASYESFLDFERIFSNTGIPVYVVPGNHDGPSGFYEYGVQSEFFSNSDISEKLVNLAGLRLLGVNSCIESEMTGAISKDVLQLIRNETQLVEQSPLVIVLHHPPFKPGTGDFDRISEIENISELENVIRLAKTKPIILCGHVHRPYFSSWNGANCFIGGSAAKSFGASQPFGKDEVSQTGEQYYYFVHSLDESGNHVSTTRSLS